MNEAPPLVRAEGLRHVRAGREVLRLDHLHLQPGAHRLLLGASGSGKTTLIHILAGLVTPTQGLAEVGGQPMSQLPPAQRDALRRTHIGLVFQTLRLIPALSLRDNLLLAQRIALGRPDREAADALILRLGLAHRAGARPRALSQGEAQRTAIARALVTRPRLIIADEPTSALDDRNATAILDLLFETATETGATLLVATHDRRIAPRFAEVLELVAPQAEAA